MVAPDENLRSRRAFLKTALVGAATTLIGSTAAHADYPDVVFQHQSPRLSVSALSLSEASQLVGKKKVSPVELTEECLRRIEQLNPKLNAFITVTADTALAEAREAEAEIQGGRWRGALHGMPIALKDLVDTASVRTTAASGLFKDRIPTKDARSSAASKLLGRCF